jgi:hypothetical protein
MIGLLSSRLIDESSVPKELVPLLDPLDLTEAFVSEFCCFSFEDVSGEKFVHNSFEMKFVLCHTKIGE